LRAARKAALLGNWMVVLMAAVKAVRSAGNSAVLMADWSVAWRAVPWVWRRADERAEKKAAHWAVPTAESSAEWKGAQRADSRVGWTALKTVARRAASKAVTTAGAKVDQTAVWRVGCWVDLWAGRKVAWSAA